MSPKSVGRMKMPPDPQPPRWIHRMRRQGSWGRPSAFEVVGRGWPPAGGEEGRGRGRPLAGGSERERGQGEGARVSGGNKERAATGV